MRKDKGSYRKVFIFDKLNIVVKLPKAYVEKISKNNREYNEYKFKYFIDGWKSNIYEILNWHKNYFNQKLKDFLCPIVFHDLLGLVIVMRKADVFQNSKTMNENEKEYVMTMTETYKNNPIMNDCQPCNLGIYKNRVVKIDYGDNKNNI